MSEFDHSVFLLSSNPYHLGHQENLRVANDVADHTIVGIGSHKRSLNILNPFTSDEKEAMIKASMTEAERSRSTFIKVRDSLYNYDLWLSMVQGQVGRITGSGHKKIAIVGAGKDQNSFYMKSFPKWTRLSTRVKTPVDEEAILSALYSGTDRYATSQKPSQKKKDELSFYLDNFVPPATAEFLTSFASESNKEFIRQQEEWYFVDSYMAPYRSLPYPVLFQTGDAVVVQGAHVLVIRRGGRPGYGQLALPGGFVNRNETSAQCIWRELREETTIKVPDRPLLKSWVASERFDHPERSVRGRTITEAGLFLLDDEADLPLVRARDDASEAFWMPLDDTHEFQDQFFEDHYFIIWHMLSRHARRNDKAHIASLLRRDNGVEV